VVEPRHRRRRTHRHIVLHGLMSLSTGHMVTGEPTTTRPLSVWLHHGAGRVGRRRSRWGLPLGLVPEVAWANYEDVRTPPHRVRCEPQTSSFRCGPWRAAGDGVGPGDASRDDIQGAGLQPLYEGADDLDGGERDHHLSVQRQPRDPVDGAVPYPSLAESVIKPPYGAVEIDWAHRSRGDYGFLILVAVTTWSPGKVEPPARLVFPHLHVLWSGYTAATLYTTPIRE